MSPYNLPGYFIKRNWICDCPHGTSILPKRKKNPNITGLSMYSKVWPIETGSGMCRYWTGVPIEDGNFQSIGARGRDQEAHKWDEGVEWETPFLWGQVGIKHVDKPVTIGAQGKPLSLWNSSLARRPQGDRGKLLRVLFLEVGEHDSPCRPSCLLSHSCWGQPLFGLGICFLETSILPFFKLFFPPEFHGCCCYYRFCCRDLQNVILMERKVLLVCWSTGGATGSLKPRVCPADTTCFPQTDFPRPWWSGIQLSFQLWPRASCWWLPVSSDQFNAHPGCAPGSIPPKPTQLWVHFQLPPP